MFALFIATRLGDLLDDFGQVLKPLATYNLPKSPTFLCKFFKGVKIYHFSSEIIFGQLLQTFGDFFLGHTGFIQRSDPFSPTGHTSTQKHFV